MLNKSFRGFKVNNFPPLKSNTYGGKSPEGECRVRRREQFVEEILKCLFDNHHYNNEEITPGGRRVN